MKKVVCFILFSFALFLYGALFYTPAPDKDATTFIVESQYIDAFSTTCGITVLSDEDFNGGGTGVILENGNIITAKHVADRNGNGRIDWAEKQVRIKFYYPKEFECRGRIIFAPKEKLIIARGFDFCIIKPEVRIKSNIRLASIVEHLDIGVGKGLYTIGRMDGDDPHISVGMQSMPAKGNYLYDRINMRLWYGNSGGGIFTKDDDSLVGISSIIRDASGRYNPAIWSGYMSATNIRVYLWMNGSEYMVDSYYDAREFKEKKYINISFIILWCFLGGYFGREVLCKKMRHMPGDNAIV